jgi:hypothetical protein
MDDFTSRPARSRDAHLFDNPPNEDGTPAAEQAATGEGAEASPSEPGADPAVAKFKSCRWRATPDQGEFCTHRDVLPFAGKEGFKPESWCPECAFYKLRRTPKKRERIDYSY